MSTETKAAYINVRTTRLHNGSLHKRVYLLDRCDYPNGPDDPGR
jgi:hypothetical protein